MGRRRRGIGLALASLLVVGSCRSEDGNDAQLDERAAIAVCLTEDGASESDATLVSDLCRVDVGQAKASVIRRGVKGGSGVALSPSRRSAAFVADGALRVIDINGEHERVVGGDGWAPEWMTDNRIGLVSPDRRQIVGFDPSGDATATVLFEVNDEVALDGPTVIDSFAWHEPSQQMVVALYRDDVGTDQIVSSSLVTIGADGTPVTLLGPADKPFAGPDFRPDGKELLVGIDYDIHLVDIATRETSLWGSTTWLSASPTWSADGTEAMWLSDGVGGEDGPSALMHAGAGGIPTPLIGSHDQPFELLPAFPTWH